jgi:hypothetical protein
MTTLQHVSQHTLRNRIGVREIVAALAALIAIAALTVVLVVSSGDAKSAHPAVGRSAASSSESPRTDVKYLATHQRPAPDAPTGQSLQTEPKYLATHPSR